MLPTPFGYHDGYQILSSQLYTNQIPSSDIYNQDYKKKVKYHLIIYNHNSQLFLKMSNNHLSISNHCVVSNSQGNTSRSYRTAQSWKYCQIADEHMFYYLPQHGKFHTYFPLQCWFSCQEIFICHGNSNN